MQISRYENDGRTYQQNRSLDVCRGLLHLGGSILLWLYLVVDMAVDPKICAYFAVWVLVAAHSVADILFEFALVDLSVFPRKFAPSILQIIKVVAFKFIPVVTSPLAFSFTSSLNKISLIYTSIFPGIRAQSIKESISEIAHVNISVDKFFCSMTILESFLELSFIIETVMIENYRLSCFFPMLKISNVLISLLVNVASLSVRFALQPFTVISQEVRAWLFGEKFNGAFTVSCAIFELSQVNILAWDVFKAKTIFFCLAGKVSVPISKVEGPAVVPYNIFTGHHLEVDSVLKFTRDYLLLALAQRNVEQFVNVFSDFLQFHERLGGLRCFKWKSLRSLQFLQQFCLKIIVYTCDLPLWIKDKYLLKFLWLLWHYCFYLLCSFLLLQIIRQKFFSFKLLFILLLVLFRWCSFFLYHCFGIFLFEAIVGQRFVLDLRTKVGIWLHGFKIAHLSLIYLRPPLIIR